MRGGPFERLDAVQVRLAEMRHHVAGIELEGFLRRLEVRPVVRKLQESSELTLLAVEAIDLGDGVVRRADHDAAGGSEDLQRVALGQMGEARRIDALEILEPLVEA